jgi:hypothetical protein
MTSKLLKEAIADAKAVRETALANAKIALEEAFTPKLQSMLSRKLKEELEGDELEEEEEVSVKENAVSSDIGKGDNKQPAAKAFDSAADSDELGKAGVKKQTAASGEEDENLEVVAEGEELEEDDVTGATPDSGINEEEEEVKEGEELAKEGEEEVANEGDDHDIELSEIIAELEDELAKEGEEEVAKEGEEHTYEGEEPTYEGEEVAKEGEELAKEGDELDLDEILREMGYGDAPAAEVEEGEELEIDLAKEGEDATADVDALQKEVEEKEEELKEAYKVIKSLKGTINEVNLLNAKLLYVNKLFRSYNLTNEQKSKIVETLDRTKNVREVKLVYSTIAESFRAGAGVSRKPVTKLTESYASKPAKSTAPAKKVISESANMANRFKKLAGINK